MVYAPFPMLIKEQNLVKVKFYDLVADELLKFAVIISQNNGKWFYKSAKYFYKTLKRRKNENI